MFQRVGHRETETKRKGRRDEDCELTASVLVTVVPAVVVSIALPLGRDAGTLPKRTDRACEVVPPTRTLGAALNSCTHTQTHRKRGLQLESEYQVHICSCAACFVLGGSIYQQHVFSGLLSAMQLLCHCSNELCTVNYRLIHSIQPQIRRLHSLCVSG